MEEKKVITLELTPRQVELFGLMLRLELIYMNPRSDILTLEKVDILNTIHKQITGADTYKCDPETFNEDVKYHITELQKSNRQNEEETLELLKSLLK